MREQIPLTADQNAIMSEFYSIPARRVLYGKSRRNALWDAARKHSIAASFISEIEHACPALHHQIVRHEQIGNNIQSAVFSECVYAQALADIFRLSLFKNCFDDCSFLPETVLRLLQSYSLVPRYAYMTPDGRRMLIQAGGCGGVDSALITVFELKIFTIEFKEPGAKTSEPDLPKYGEDGLLKVTPEFLSRYPQFQAMLSEKEGLNFFEIAGRNEHDFSPESVNQAIVSNYCSRKYADVLCTEDVRERLVMIPVNQVSVWAWTEGEIRPAGRNHYAVWTPSALNRFLTEAGAIISNGTVEMPLSRLEPAHPRGGCGISRYKINSLFFVRSEKVVIDGNLTRFRLGDVRQLNPTIAGKMFFVDLSYEEVRSHYFG